MTNLKIINVEMENSFSCKVDFEYKKEKGYFTFDPEDGQILEMSGKAFENTDFNEDKIFEWIENNIHIKTGVFYKDKLLMEEWEQ